MEYQSPDPYIEKKGTFYKCNLCASHLNSIAQVQSHISGANHQSRLNTRQPLLHQAETNMHSTEQKFSSFNLTAESSLPKYIEKHGFGYKCVCCDIPLNGNSQIMSHVSGAKHIKKTTSFNGHNSIPRLETKMEINDMGQPWNINKSVKMSPVVCSPCVSNIDSKSNLPPYIEKFGDQYKCGCCNTMLNSFSQINSHVSGNKHIKAKLFYDANPSFSLAKSNYENSKESKNMDESFSLYSGLKEINPEDLMKSVKVLKANEDIIF